MDPSWLTIASPDPLAHYKGVSTTLGTQLYRTLTYFGNLPGDARRRGRDTDGVEPSAGALQRRQLSTRRTVLRALDFFAWNCRPHVQRLHVAVPGDFVYRDFGLQRPVHGGEHSGV